MMMTVLLVVAGLVGLIGVVSVLIWCTAVTLVRRRHRELIAEARVLREDCAVLEDENAQLGAENLRLKLALDTTRALLRTRVREGPAAVAPLH